METTEHSTTLAAATAVPTPAGSADPAAAPNPTRRRLLQAAGATVAAAALTGGVTSIAGAAPRPSRVSVAADGLKKVSTIAELASLTPRDADVVVVAGYHAPGDGGGMWVRWDSASTAEPNGGTVHLGGGSASAAGRWLQLHDGVGDFRRFGIFGPDKPADAALVAMVNDPSFHRIEAHTDLNFVKRNVLTRSTITLDFGGNLVSTEGIEPTTKAGDYFGAVLFFTGVRSTHTQKVTLTAVLPELVDVYEVSDSSWFAVGEWLAMESDAKPGGGKAQMEIQRLVEVMEIVDATHIRVGYKNGWELPAGRVLSYTKVDPVVDVTVCNMRFEGTGTDQYTGSHPLAFEYAVRCDVDSIHANRTFWCLLMRRWCTHFTTSNCTQSNPIDPKIGGAGYLTQQLYCLYGHVYDCQTFNARHLNDWTASAYCLVENCHGTGDYYGPFVTHGQYEHDLTYIGNSGMMTFANSGAQWGGFAKRITVIKHVCPLFFARTNVIDITLQDVHVRKDPNAPGGQTPYEAWFWANTDGLQMRGCTVDGITNFSQGTSLSQRPNVVEGCSLSTSRQSIAGVPDFTAASVVKPIAFVHTTVKDLDGAVVGFKGTGPLRFTDCTIASVPGAAPLALDVTELALESTALVDTCVEMSGTRDQTVRVSGHSTLTSSQGGSTVLSRAGASGTVTWNFDSMTSTAGDPSITHLRIDKGTNHYRAIGATFLSGRLDLPDAGFGANSSMIHSACVEGALTRSAWPTPGPRVIDDANLSW